MEKKSQIPANKRYHVGATASHRHGYAGTLAEAKKIGSQIARKEAWRGKWNLMWIAISIDKYTTPWSTRATGWYMYVPVRGSGRRADYILSELKRRHGVEPFVWTKK